jgi:hypothetical protein
VDPLYATVEEEHQRQDIELSQNEAYTATNIPVHTNSTITPSIDPDQLYATVEGEQDIELSQNEAYTAINVPVETNQCYSTTTTSVDSGQHYTTMEGERQPAPPRGTLNLL